MNGAPGAVEREVTPIESVSVTSSRPPLLRPRYFQAVSAVLASALVVLVGILSFNGGSLVPNSRHSGNPVYIPIDGIHRTIDYRGNWTGYLGPTVNDSCDQCPLGVQAGSSIVLPLMIINEPKNITLTIFYNISGPFLMASTAGCNYPGCTIPWTNQTVSLFLALASPGIHTVIWWAFLMPSLPPPGPTFIWFNASVCPSTICPLP